MDVNTNGLSKNAKDGINNVTSTFGGLADKAVDKADKFADKAKSGIDQASKELQNVDLQSRYSQIKSQAADALDASTDIVKKYPLYALLGATAVGFAVGFIAKRSLSAKKD